MANIYFLISVVIAFLAGDISKKVRFDAASAAVSALIFFLQLPELQSVIDGGLLFSLIYFNSGHNVQLTDIAV